MKKRAVMLGIALMMLTLLSGCLLRSPDDLYRQPEKSPGYEQLNAAIRAVRTGLEAEFGTRVEDVTIMAGDNTANIQLQDLDGDGLRESAVTFSGYRALRSLLKSTSLPRLMRNMWSPA